MTRPAPTAPADSLDDETLETELITQLASGHLDEIRAMVDASDSDRLVVALARADARLRVSAIGTLELQALQRRAVRDEGLVSPYGVWATAMLAERLMLDGDYAAHGLATTTLDKIADDPLGRLPLVYGRARLLRVAASVWLLMPIPDGLRAYRIQTEDAIRSLLRCGFVQEVAVTSGIAAVLQVIFLRADPQENFTRVLEARAVLGDDERSVNAIMLDYFIGILAMYLGEIGTMLDAADRIERSGVNHLRLRPFVYYARAWARLKTEGGTPEVIDEIDAALRRLNEDPRILQLWRQHIAHALANQGNALAGRYARALLQLPAFGPADTIDREILGHRVALLEGRPVSPAEVIARLTELGDLGRQRGAFFDALRVARDLERAGDRDGAAELYHWGLKLRDPGWELSRQELRLLHELADGDDRADDDADGAWNPPPAPGLAVRVLGPRFQIEVEGRSLELGRKQSLLLVALVLHHPAPVQVDEASELLWPDAAMSATRLNSVVHRLRDKLGEARGTVVRTGSLLALDPARCTVDLWEHRRRLAGPRQEARQALKDVPGNLCTAELRDHEYLTAERARFRAEWLRHARSLVGAGDVTPAELDDALRVLGLDAAELDSGHEP